MDANEKFIYMTTEPVPRLVTSLAVPTIISMLITSFYNMVDTFFVGRINTSATAAVGVVFSLMAVIQAIGFFFGHGSGNYISRKLGERNTEEASLMASFGFFFGADCRRGTDGRRSDLYRTAGKTSRFHRNDSPLCHGLSPVYFDRCALYDGISGFK